MSTVHDVLSFTLWNDTPNEHILREQSGILGKYVCFTLGVTQECGHQYCQTHAFSAWAAAISYLNSPMWFYFTMVDFLCCSKLLCCDFYTPETAAVLTDGKWKK